MSTHSATRPRMRTEDSTGIHVQGSVIEAEEIENRFIDDAQVPTFSQKQHAIDVAELHNTSGRIEMMTQSYVEMQTVRELSCYRHREIETALLCTVCDRSICVRCMTIAAVGQLCPDCRKERRSVHYRVSPLHLVKGGLITLGITIPIAAFIGMLGPWILLVCVLGPGAARIILHAIEWATHCKRGYQMQVVTALAIVLGSGFAAYSTYLVGALDMLTITLFSMICIALVVPRLR